MTQAKKSTAKTRGQARAATRPEPTRRSEPRTEAAQTGAAGAPAPQAEARAQAAPQAGSGETAAPQAGSEAKPAPQAGAPEAEAAPQTESRAEAAPRAGSAGAQKAPQAAAKAAEKTAEAVSESAQTSPADLAAAFGFVPFQSLMNAQRAQMDALVQANRACMECMGAINREVMAFTDRRARAMLDGQRSAPTSGDWGEVWSYQIDYAGRATQAYIEEATRLFDLGVKLSQESLAPLQEQMNAALGATLRKEK